MYVISTAFLSKQREGKLVNLSFITHFKVDLPITAPSIAYCQALYLHL